MPAGRGVREVPAADSGQRHDATHAMIAATSARHAEPVSLGCGALVV